MNISLAIAGLVCLGLALGHALTGRAVVPTLPRDLPATRFGSGGYTRGLFRFTWHALTVMLTTTGAILLSLAYGPRFRGNPVAAQYPALPPEGASAGYGSEIAFLIGAGYAVALVVLLWMTKRRPSDLMRIPVWAGFVVIIGLCWFKA